MKKSLCTLLLLILLPFGAAQSAEFKLTGRTTWQLGQLMVNGPLCSTNRPVSRTG